MLLSVVTKPETVIVDAGVAAVSETLCLPSNVKLTQRILACC